jgi:hypothetical protein
MRPGFAGDGGSGFENSRAGKKDKGKILDGAAGTTGLNRDHLAPAREALEVRGIGQAEEV